MLLWTGSVRPRGVDLIHVRVKLMVSDKVYFWTTIRKNRSRYFACRGIREEDIASIIRQSVIIGKDPAKACTQLLELPALKRNFQRLPTENEKEYFQRHFRKYVDMYMPDCPFEVSTTNRYTIDTQEAAITARKNIRKGELIKYLIGIQIPITTEEEKELDSTKRNFSIVQSSRKGTASLFLGPARFANHDCGANARLTTSGASGMTIVAAMDINLGEEITVSYGKAYFGLDNDECLCATCESSQRNGWAAGVEESLEDARTGSALDQNMKDLPYLFRGRRSGHLSAKGSLFSSPASESPTPSRKRKRGRLENHDSPRNSPKHPRVNGQNMNQTPSKLNHELHLEDDIPSEQRNRGVTVHGNLLEPFTSASRRSTSLGSSLMADSPTSLGSTAATSVSGNAPITAEQDKLVSPSKSMTISSQRPLYDAGIDAHGFVPYIQTLKTELLMGLDRPAESCTENACDPDDTVQKNVFKFATFSKRLQAATTENPAAVSGERAVSIEDDSPSPSDTPVKRRTPGDYTLTKTLLATPYSRWVECGTCSQHFVQSDAYQTRRACPRCERHSKLYGYAWPKTGKKGKNDTEERILDHRTVHRFVLPDEEREIRKGKSISLRDILAEKGNSAKPCVDDSDDDEPHSKRMKALRKRKHDLEEEGDEEEIELETDNRGRYGQHQVRKTNKREIMSRTLAPQPVIQCESQAEGTRSEFTQITRKSNLSGTYDGCKAQVAEDSTEIPSPTIKEAKSRWKGWVIVGADDVKYEAARSIRCRSRKRKRETPGNDEVESGLQRTKRARTADHPTPTVKDGIIGRPHKKRGRPRKDSLPTPQAPDVYVNRGGRTPGHRVNDLQDCRATTLPDVEVEDENEDVRVLSHVATPLVRNTPLKIRKRRVTRSKRGEAPQRKSARTHISSPITKTTRSSLLSRPLPTADPPTTDPATSTDDAADLWVYTRGKPRKDGSWGPRWRYDIEVVEPPSGSSARYGSELPDKTSIIASLSRTAEVGEPPPGSSAGRNPDSSVVSPSPRAEAAVGSSVNGYDSGLLDETSIIASRSKRAEVVEPPSGSSANRSGNELLEKTSSIASLSKTAEVLEPHSCSSANEVRVGDSTIVSPSTSFEGPSCNSPAPNHDHRPDGHSRFVTPSKKAVVAPLSASYASRDFSELSDQTNIVTSLLGDTAAGRSAARDHDEIPNNEKSFVTRSKEAGIAVVETSSGSSASRAFSELPDNTSFVISLTEIAKIPPLKVEMGAGSSASRGCNGFSELPDKNSSIISLSKTPGIPAFERKAGSISSASPYISRRENSVTVTPPKRAGMPLFRGYTGAGSFARQYHDELGHEDGILVSPSSLKAERVAFAAATGGGFSTFGGTAGGGLSASPTTAGNEQREKPGKLKRPTRTSTVPGFAEEEEGPDAVWHFKVEPCDAGIWAWR